MYYHLDFLLTFLFWFRYEWRNDTSWMRFIEVRTQFHVCQLKHLHYPFFAYSIPRCFVYSLLLTTLLQQPPVHSDLLVTKQPPWFLHNRHLRSNTVMSILLRDEIVARVVSCWCFQMLSDFRLRNQIIDKGCRRKN